MSLYMNMLPGDLLREMREYIGFRGPDPEISYSVIDYTSEQWDKPWRVPMLENVYRAKIKIKHNGISLKVKFLFKFVDEPTEMTSFLSGEPTFLNIDHCSIHKTEKYLIVNGMKFSGKVQEKILDILREISTLDNGRHITNWR